MFMFRRHHISSHDHTEATRKKGLNVEEPPSYATQEGFIFEEAGWGLHQCVGQ